MNTLEKIRYLRFMNKYIQAEVAEKIGIGRTNYCQYESGKRNFTIEHIKKIAKLYNVSIAYLLDENQNEINISLDDLKILNEASKVITKIKTCYDEATKNEQDQIS